ncbi:aminotransferase class I/II-fold pyridoxal phosphate-dependent enzyme [Embleya sp. NPDC020886]|uniref:aminotransferase class I/II-fold pyridoxal phosphate-dependent enzyme n=1 Tax=Embleya sp. NPDC020886 TaxID=3363980 RepID=UPI00379A4652
MTHFGGARRPALADPVLRSTRVLNEVAERHPEALSFATGRPYEGGSLAGGGQQALFLTLRALRGSDRDVVLALTPTYLGLTDAARRADLPVLPVADGPRGVDLDDLAAQVHGARAAGLRPRALYLVPDFANSSGVSLDEPARRDLLSAAQELDLLVLEDDPYGLVHAAGRHRPPTLAALDTRQRVLNPGQFAGSGPLGARIARVVDTDTGRPVGPFVDLPTRSERASTALSSAMLRPAGTGTSRPRAADSRSRWADRRHPTRLANGLAARFGRGPTADRVHWHCSDGGGFVVLTVPFVVDDALLELSAREYGVLWTPMAHFYDPGVGPAHRLRLAAGALGPTGIDEGLDRLTALVEDRAREQMRSFTRRRPGRRRPAPDRDEGPRAARDQP